MNLPQFHNNKDHQQAAAAKRQHEVKVLEAIRHDMIVINTGCIQGLQEFATVTLACHLTKRVFGQLYGLAVSMIGEIKNLNGHLQTVRQQRNALQKELLLMQGCCANMLDDKMNQQQEEKVQQWV